MTFEQRCRQLAHSPRLVSEYITENAQIAMHETVGCIDRIFRRPFLAISDARFGASPCAISFSTKPYGTPSMLSTTSFGQVLDVILVLCPLSSHRCIPAEEGCHPSDVAKSSCLRSNGFRHLRVKMRYAVPRRERALPRTGKSHQLLNRWNPLKRG